MNHLNITFITSGLSLLSLPLPLRCQSQMSGADNRLTKPSFVDFVDLSNQFTTEGDTAGGRVTASLWIRIVNRYQFNKFRRHCSYDLVNVVSNSWIPPLSSRSFNICLWLFCCVSVGGIGSPTLSVKILPSMVSKVSKAQCSTKLAYNTLFKQFVNLVE